MHVGYTAKRGGAPAVKKLVLLRRRTYIYIYVVNRRLGEFTLLRRRRDQCMTSSRRRQDVEFFDGKLPEKPYSICYTRMQTTFQ